VVGSPLHGVVDFSGCYLLRRLRGFLVHFSFGLEEYEAIFCAMIGLVVVKHIVQRSECVWASATTTTAIWCAASLIVLSESLIGGPRVSFLQRWPKILLPILWWPTTIKINAMHQLGVAVLIVIVAKGSWGFILLSSFSLLLKLAEMLDLQLAEFCKLFVELWHCFGPPPD
jgi:hypothetical protein